MRELLLLAIHLMVTIAKFLRPAGACAIAAESLLLKHQLLISNRSRHVSWTHSAITTMSFEYTARSMGQRSHSALAIRHLNLFAWSSHVAPALRWSIPDSDCCLTTISHPTGSGMMAGATFGRIAGAHAALTCASAIGVKP